MADAGDQAKISAQAEERVEQILKAAASWARELPPALAPAVRAVCIRLGELVADQRNYLAPLPQPQESERSAVLTLLAQRLASTAVATGVEKELAALTELELKSTGSWALVPSAQAEWITTAIRFLEGCAAKLPARRAPRSLLGRRRRGRGHRVGARRDRRSTNSTPGPRPAIRAGSRRSGTKRSTRRPAVRRTSERQRFLPTS